MTPEKAMATTRRLVDYDSYDSRSGVQLLGHSSFSLFSFKETVACFSATETNQTFASCISDCPVTVSLPIAAARLASLHIVHGSPEKLEERTSGPSVDLPIKNSASYLRPDLKPRSTSIDQ